ncbi:DUF6883 domain-containing protein [Methylobacterium sp. Leaf108]|uniref:DUF6883 domain-containing protein n=1 Tax=Methylobacterium sp. Leaf108 TaxID=1736256 RepID=UPI000701421F|nr:DUF6883 domain-containing protein [Methylobacterium sp. Leaf108]KQP61727.1 hypothetical protein ASF39_03415 [Methylobacterium sp. Leaf108]
MNPAKIVGYLLNLHHALGGPKARFFLAFGFSVSDPETLGRAILDHAVPDHFAGRVVGKAGDIRLVYAGPIRTPDGRNPRIRTVWLAEAHNTARFITAYPDR